MDTDVRKRWARSNQNITKKLSVQRLGKSEQKLAKIMGTNKMSA
jgi:hypothetical protein